MQKNVEQLIDDIIAMEGGFVDHPDDRGGPTKYGITQATLADWLGRPVTKEDVRALTNATAAQIYHRNYYCQPGIDRLPETLRPLIFDMVVNHGPAQAIRILQRAVGKFAPCTIDGVIGPQTLAAIQTAMACTLANALVEKRKYFYQRIAANDPSQRRFLNGWLARADSFKV